MSGTLPHWIERLLGLEVAAGEGTVWRLESYWAWPSWATLLFAVLCVAFVVTIYLRENRRASRTYRMMLAAIRLAVLAIVWLMISQLALSLHRTGLPYVAVLIDDSLSMNFPDQYEDKIRQALQKRIQKADPAAESADAEPTRWNLAKTYLTERDAAVLRSIADDYKLRVYYLTGPRPSRKSEPGALADEIRARKPVGETTRLGAGVRAVLDDLRGTSPAAIVLLTDGINTEGPPLVQAAAAARRKGVPLFIVGVGNDRPVRDLQLSNLLVDPLVFLDDVIQFEFQVTGTGLDGRTARVVLREEGKPEVLAEKQITIGPDGSPRQVRLPYRATEVGRFRYVVEVEPLEDEPLTDNNRDDAPVEVRKEKIRVLLVQAHPSFEYRYLRRVLHRDETIELDWLLQDADPEYAQQDPSALDVFPVRRDELFSYDVIILGDANPDLLSTAAMQDLVEFVDRPGKGGSLVLIAGSRYMPSAYRDTPLARVIPIEFASLRYPDESRPISEASAIYPTETGLSGPTMQLGNTQAETRTIWRNLPPVYWMLEVHDLKPGRVLAEHPTRRRNDGQPLPLISLHFVGAGKVLFHATNETYRWRREMGDLYFGRYWIQTIRYLARSKLAGNRSATLTADPTECEEGESVRLRLRFTDERMAPEADDGVTVVVEHEGHKTRRIRLHRSGTGRGIFQGVLDGPAPGDYHAWVAVPALEGRAPAAGFRVSHKADEQQRVEMDVAVMRRAAQLTRGRYYRFAEAGRLTKDLPPGRQVPIETLPPKPLWNWWPVLALFLTLLIAEWILRKRGGMV